MIILYLFYNLTLFVKIMKKYHDDFHAEYFEVKKMIAIIC